MDLSKVLTLDVECYQNYLLVMFRKVTDGKILYFEKFNNGELNRANILHMINKYTIVTFNGIKYDMAIVEAAIAGFSNLAIHKVSTYLIEEKKQPWQARKQFGFPQLEADHIDLMEVAPLQASLKIYMGRLHAPKMQDLPIPPDAVIHESDLPDMRKYCGNDNEGTAILLKQLIPEIELRTNMSEEYGVDLRSKSDAQIAEAVIKKEIEEQFGKQLRKPKDVKKIHKYVPPSNLGFQTEVMQDVFRQYTTLPFTVGSSGYTEFNFELVESDRIKSGKNKGKMPEKKGKLKFEFGASKYTVGIGGLHSNEKSARHEATDDIIVRDYDVASFYPRIILNNKLYPKHIGKAFLDIYNGIVERRLHAKQTGDKVTDESLKITINGSFGKLGSKWSVLYSPDLMLQVTITGQLSLLMLIERLELAGISVISANTDGIVLKFHKDNEDKVEQIVDEWQFDTDYELEATDYLSLNSRDVNNYIAVKEGSTKGKGAYADHYEHYYMLRTNPVNDICSEAVKEFLMSGKPVEQTIKACGDIRKFLNIRTVNGGAIHDGNKLGKAIRWYYGANELDAIYYVTSGNKVPKSDGGVPLMDLPDKFPKDVDYQWYINEANSILKDIGYKS